MHSPAPLTCGSHKVTTTLAFRWMVAVTIQDLVKRMLTVDHRKRITTAEVECHSPARVASDLVICCLFRLTWLLLLGAVHSCVCISRLGVPDPKPRVDCQLPAPRPPRGYTGSHEALQCAQKVQGTPHTTGTRPRRCCAATANTNG